MGILSTTVSLTRYRVGGRLADPAMDTIRNGLITHSITEIDNDVNEKSIGWTCFERPYQPDFEGSSFVFGTYLVFALRIDRKSVSVKTLKKHVSIEESRKLTESGRQYLSANEKKMLKESVLQALYLKTPSTPNVYDLVWNLEEGRLWFFSTLKSANEALETVFSKSFKLALIRLFPYTSADLISDLSDPEKDALNKLTPTRFSG
jgi:recombination associated protein RdgC